MGTVLVGFLVLWGLAAVGFGSYCFFVLGRWPKPHTPTPQEQARLREWQERKLRAAKKTI